MQSEVPQCSKVPTVDLGELGVHHTKEPSQEEWERVMRELEQAFTDIGCAYLTGHGVPDDMIKEVLSSAVDFFKLEEDVKARWTAAGFEGYLHMNSEKLSGEQYELCESFRFRPGAYNSCEDETPPFVPSVTPLFPLVQVLSRRLMITVACSLNKERDYFVNMHQDSGTKKSMGGYRLNYYHMVTDGQEDATGFSAHSDLTTMSFLFSNDSEGFQVCDAAGQWIDVPFVPGTILVLVGEFLHLHSNKRFIPPLHRVVLPSDQHSGRPPRRTLVYFELADGHHPWWPHSDNPASPAPPSVKDYVDKRIGRAKEDGAKYQDKTER